MEVKAIKQSEVEIVKQTDKPKNQSTNKDIESHIEKDFNKNNTYLLYNQKMSIKNKIILIIK